LFPKSSNTIRLGGGGGGTSEIVTLPESVAIGMTAQPEMTTSLTIRFTSTL